MLGGEVLVGLLEGLGVTDHVLDLGAGESSDAVGNGDVGPASGSTVESRDLQETVGVNLESADELRLSTGLGGDTRELCGASSAIDTRGGS